MSVSEYRVSGPNQKNNFTNRFFCGIMSPNMVAVPSFLRKTGSRCIRV